MARTLRTFLFSKERYPKKSAPATGRLTGRSALLLRGLALGVLRGQIHFHGMIFAERENNGQSVFRASLEAAREGSAESRASDLLERRGFLGYFFCRNKKSDRGLSKSA